MPGIFVYNFVNLLWLYQKYILQDTCKINTVVLEILPLDFFLVGEINVFRKG